MPRIDTHALKRDHAVDLVVARYGIDLRQAGRALVGRCPFHPDGGRPNLHVYPGNGSWYCYRCAVGGDVISFVERVERLGFRDAVDRLRATGGAGLAARAPTLRPGRRLRGRRAPAAGWGHDERACLAAAVELYHNRLLTEPGALAYLERRGLERATIERYRIGYAAGGELAAYLRWRRLPAGAAVRAGLLGRRGREFLAGRVVVPEFRGGQPVWLVGRTIDPDASGPKYLGLPGPKPVFGWEEAAGSASVTLVEGVFDWLNLRQWDLPALALVGTYVRPEVLRELGARFRRCFLALDADEAGGEAAVAIERVLGSKAVRVSLPAGVKDVADLALEPEGRLLFTRALPSEEQDLPDAA